MTLIFALMAVVLTGKSQCPCCFHNIHHKLEYAVPKNAWTTTTSSMACSSNVINLIQPTDQGNIIQQYKRKLLRKLVIEKEVHVSTQKVLKTVDFRGAGLTAETWTEVPRTTLCKYKELTSVPALSCRCMTYAYLNCYVSYVFYRYSYMPIYGLLCLPVVYYVYL